MGTFDSPPICLRHLHRNSGDRRHTHAPPPGPLLRGLGVGGPWFTVKPLSDKSYPKHRAVSEYCPACVSHVGLSTKLATGPYSDNLLNRTRNPSEPYLDKEIPLRSFEAVALLVGFPSRNPPKIGTFTDFNLNSALLLISHALPKEVFRKRKGGSLLKGPFISRTSNS